jgi:hypothetical protein
VLITQFQAEDHGAWLARVSGELSDALTATRCSEASDTDLAPADERSQRTPADQDAETSLSSSPFDPRLLALPARLDQVTALIEATELRSSVMRLADALRPTLVLSAPERPRESDLLSARQQLRDAADRLVYAEQVEEGVDFLATDALVSLVAAHRTEVPIEVVVGAKGAGKTFTYLGACLAGTWAAFAQMAGVRNVDDDLPIVPVLASQNLSDGLQDRLVQVRDRSAHLLTTSASTSFLDIRETVTAALDCDLDDAGWRKVWLRCFARAAGLSVQPDTVESLG